MSRTLQYKNVYDIFCKTQAINGNIFVCNDCMNEQRIKSITFFFPFSFPMCRIESYSCKMAGDDKHMFKQFCQEGEPHVLEALSPPQSSSAPSPNL